MLLSLVIPVMNEEKNILPLIKAIEKALGDTAYEVIFIDDGSSDNTVDIIKSLSNNHIQLIVFARNFGQTSAIAAGINDAKGEFIATLDGDLQNDPADILPMLEKLQDESLDIVTGIRSKRQDNLLIRKLPSAMANMLIRKMTKVDVQDYGCTLKVFRADSAKKLDLFGELHRFIPILASLEGAKVAEMPVKHHPRRNGTTKYGLGRTFKVLSDVMLMVFFIKYRQKPMHLFGTLGALMGLTGGVIEGYLLILKILGHDIGHRPLFFVGILLIIASIQLITTGFLAELLMRTYYGSQNKRPYAIKAVYKAGKQTELD